MKFAEDIAICFKQINRIGLEGRVLGFFLEGELGIWTAARILLDICI